MTLQSLLVSSDDSAADVLGRVLPMLGMAMDRSTEPETTLARIRQQKFDALIVDFDEAKLATQVVEQASQLGLDCLNVALVADPSRVRDILSSGAHFVLYKPVTEEAAKAGLRAAAALLSRERRRAVRIPVQAAVEIRLPDERKVDGILLDLSETGMDVLTAEPQVAGALLGFHFQLPDGALQVDAHGRVAWANPNGQTGVHFLDLPEQTSQDLKKWLKAAASSAGASSDETVPHCKLTDLSLGGCYVETEAPFPEHALVDLGLKTEKMEVHIDGMVRVAHPGHGMGVEFPSRTAEQRAQVGNLIEVLRSSPDTTPELTISPRALVADMTQFERPEGVNGPEELDDPLLELLRRGTSLQQDDFLSELRHQRSPEDVASA
ncbi:MAG TPA: PilZ domain-containing protein [Verrucomicrobiae bacterium]|nr:PilZ domain-containing protein [Verrucomicrobiae bacterium]